MQNARARPGSQGLIGLHSCQFPQSAAQAGEFLATARETSRHHPRFATFPDQSLRVFARRFDDFRRFQIDHAVSERSSHDQQSETRFLGWYPEHLGRSLDTDLAVHLAIPDKRALCLCVRLWSRVALCIPNNSTTIWANDLPVGTDCPPHDPRHGLARLNISGFPALMKCGLPLG